jgi:thiamine kinase-like enzyme
VGELDDILPELEAALGPLVQPPAPLEGGITNRNFRVGLGGTEYVVRRNGKATGLLGIDREAERLASETAAALGIAPAVAAVLPDGLVTRYVPCAALAPPELSSRIAEVGRALRSFHDSGVRLPVSFWVPDLLAGYARIVRERGGELPADYRETSEIVARIAAALPAPERRPCHNDLLLGNIIRAQDDDRLLLVDWEYAGMGHPFFDLGNLAVNNALDEDAEERMLSAYLGGPATDSSRALLRVMRVLSDAREAGWGVVQAHVSELDFDFDGYAAEHFERLLAAAHEPEFEECLATA